MNGMDLLYEALRTLARPSHALLLGALLGLVLRPWRPRTATLLQALGLGGLLVSGLLPVGAYLAAPLEARFPRPDPPPAHVDGIVLLGGFMVPESGCDGGTIRLNDAGARLVEALLLARRHPGARLLVAGGGWRHAEGCSEAERTARFLLRYGIDRDRLLLETRSRNTRENAVHAYALARPEPGEIWLLVTSAVHMPRALAAFRRVGFPVVPWPADAMAHRGCSGRPWWTCRGAGGSWISPPTNGWGCCGTAGGAGSTDDRGRPLKPRSSAPARAGRGERPPWRNPRADSMPP